MQQKRLFILLILALYIPAIGLKAQSFSFSYNSQIKVINAGDTLKNAWAGGLNSPQFSKMDLDGDGMEDLVVFDRTNNKISTFLTRFAEGKISYLYKPEYENYFPLLESWLLLVDYNHDGKKDIFTQGGLGVKVYKNISQATIEWKLMKDPVYSKGFNGPVNLAMGYTDLPSISDIDNDGDYDILGFNFYNGSNVEYHLNLSKDKYGHTDSLEFKRVDDCWGGFSEIGCTDYTFGSNCSTNLRIAAPQHAGASTLLTIDLDGDGDKDALIGKEGCTQINKLINIGTPVKSNFNAIEGIFPNDIPVSFEGVPTLYFEDLDQDGIKDLIAAPSALSNNPPVINFQKSTWFYKNTGSNTIPAWKFIQKDFLQSGMIEVGENAFPAFADYDADGDPDMFIGNKSSNASIILYENIGSVQNPIFRLLSNDYLGLASKKYTSIRPGFMDMNGDNVPDLIFTSAKGTIASIKYYLNKNSTTQAFSFDTAVTHSVNVNTGAFDSPYFYDTDQDGDQDLLLGRSTGNLRYYINTGTVEEPEYDLYTDTLGGIKSDFYKSYLSVFITDLNYDQKPDLLTADNTGTLTLYSNFLNNITQVFTPEKIEINKLGTTSSLTVGKILSVFVMDIDANGRLDIFVGNNAGGLLSLKDNATINGLSLDQMKKEFFISLSPVPSDGVFNVSSSNACKAIVTDILGRNTGNEIMIEARQEQTLDLTHLPEGLYFLNCHTKDGIQQVKRFIIRK